MKDGADRGARCERVRGTRCAVRGGFCVWRIAHDVRERGEHRAAHRVPGTAVQPRCTASAARLVAVALAALCIGSGGRLLSAWQPSAAAERQEPRAGSPTTPGRRLLLLKEKPPEGAGTPWFADYMRVLERFPRTVEHGWRAAEGGPSGGAGYFGGPGHTELAMRPLAQATLVLALLAQDGAYDPRPSGVTAERVRQRALACLREMVQTHVTGERRRPSGEAWGDGLQAPWWMGRLAIASRLLGGALGPADREAVQRVLTYEAGRQLARAPASGSLMESAAAENAWSAEALAWATCLYPDHAQAAAWEDKARRFLMNTFSVPQDRLDESLVDGHPVREWVTSVNLLPGFLAVRRGAVHPCYLALPFQSLASIHYAYAATRRPPPRALSHHLEDAWRAVQRLYLADGRILYPAGQEWPRHAYGTSFLLPALVMQQRVGSEPTVARLMERGIFNRLEREQQASGDGSFYGARFSGGAVEGRMAIFETDTYAMVGLAYLLHRLDPKVWPPASEAVLQEALAGAWEDPVASLVVARAPGLFASFAWRTLGRPSGAASSPAPIGLFAPTAAADLVEWSPDQLVGAIEAEGFDPGRRVRHRQRLVTGGFTTTGRIDEGTREGRPAVRHFLSYTALPEERIAVLLDLALAAQEVRLTRNEGLQLALANDLASGNQWTLVGDMEPMTIRGVEPGAPPRNRMLETPWLNIADALGVALVYGQEPFTLRDFSARDQRPTDTFRSLHAELLCTPFQVNPVSFRSRQVIRDTVILLVAGDAAATRQAWERAIVAPTGEELARAVWCTGASGRSYLVAANFGEKELSLFLKPPRDGGRPPVGALADDLRPLAVRLPPLDTLVLPARP